ncbi:MAG: M56 family metallopeptidase [Verrucomicrobia bacterium]|nr:M56 family metallopeptidase [Verrucomicrobiota bacterium]
MNLLLNEWGGAASRAGISILAQTAVLTLVLLTLEVITRGRLRATLRCALWMLVVLKVLLPPALSLPTGVAYWVGPWLVPPVRVSTPAEPRTSMAPAGTTKMDAQSGSVHSSDALVASVPQARLDAWGGLGLIWLTGTGVMLSWIIRRNRVVHRLVRGSHPASADQQRALEEAARRVGLRRWPQLRVTERIHSPAVCGLFRPVVLLPQGLVEKLSATALADVLLHELIHVHRHDLWLNLPQTWAVALWWWNPFVWLANARVASLREQAVDERVMLLRSGDPATYPATLVEVARHCVSGPALTLSLMGILESRRALRNRVERLLVSPLPSRAHLGATGWITVICGAFLLMPMAFARRVESGTGVISAGSTRPAINSEADLDEPTPATGLPQVYSTNETRVTSNSSHSGGWLGQQIIKTKLEGIIVPVFEFHDGTLADLVEYLEEQARAQDPEHKGLNFIINETETAPRVIDPASGREVTLGETSFRSLRPLLNTRLVDALDAMVALANRPLRYEVQDYAVVFSAPLPEVPELYTKTFQVGTNAFLIGLQAVMGVVLPAEADRKRGAAIQSAVRDFLRACGVKIPGPGVPGGTGVSGGMGRFVVTDPFANQPAVFFNDRTGVLFVRGTLADLDIVEKAIEAFKVAPPEIELEVRFFEVEPDTSLEIWAKYFTSDSESPTHAPVLTPTQVKRLMTDLEARSGTLSLGSAKVRTPAGQQAQISVIEKKTDPITGVVGQIRQLRPVLDVTPYLLIGDPSNRLKFVAQMHRVVRLAGQDWVAAQVSTIEFSTTFPTLDGHTVMMLADVGKPDASSEELRPIVVLITPLVVDPAGKSVGSDK